jgi:hypothetical protein
MCLYPDGDVADNRKFEDLGGFSVVGKVIRNKGSFIGSSAEDQRAEDICLTPITSNPRSTSP